MQPKPARLEALSPPAVGAWTLGFGTARDAFVERWLGSRLVWWPSGISRKNWIGVMSSRLGRDLRARRRWFQVLRDACGKLDRDRDVLFAATGSTTGRFVNRCQPLFGVESRRLTLPDREALLLSDWRADCDRKAAGIAAGELFVSPPLTPPEFRLGPARDRLAVALADRLYVSHVRPNGQMHSLLRERLQTDDAAAGRVFVALGEGLTDRVVAAELLDLGAVGWIVSDEIDHRTEAAEVTVEPFHVPPADEWQFLTHCTRRRDGPWPGQSESDYLDDLILDRPAADHSALATLQRIAIERRIHASSLAIRGGTPVVSFTSIPLADLPARRVFRPHRGRWDFEPYGICIRRDWLQARGARPVHYGDDSCFASLAGTDRPFFQQRFTAKGTIDWSDEREWRTVGEVVLTDLPANAAMLFVPSVAAAARLSGTCPWPIAILQQSIDRRILAEKLGTEK